jgi:hypothetical protein
MAKKKKFPIFAIILVIGIVIVGIALVDEEFPDLLPLSVILQQECRFNTIGFGQISFGDVECFLNFNSFTTNNLPFQRVLPLSGIDTNSQMILDFNFDAQAGTVLPECATFVTDATRLTLTDENGNIITVATEGITDIQPLLLPNQRTLVINFDATTTGICPTQDIRYIGGGGSNNNLSFLQRPPERVSESFESFTAITQSRAELDLDFTFPANVVLRPTINYGVGIRVDNDFSATLTAFVWNLDTTPPERVSESFESFTAITQSRAELDLDFTFPANVVLQPNTNYGVGIRVDQNLGQQFAYTQSDQIADTHECVIDRNASTEGEVMFEPNGLCGFDISHSQFLASLLQPATGQEGDTGSQGIQGEIGETGAQGSQGLQGIQGIQGESAPPLTQEELIAILCDGSESEPALCSNISQNLFQNLQIGQFSIELLLLIGIIIIILGVAGIIVRRRR